ncbi:MAG TPA: M48 family metalloprotease, partial [Planctomycetota bacterium]|nr:M48 family metalloprotease [Planctomycetota bacterium]
MRTSRLGGAAGAVLGIALAAGCATNPATGKPEFNLISEQQELQLGDQAAPDAVKQFGGLYPDAAVQQEVSEVGMKLAAAAPRPNMHWSYQVVNSDEVNAFALPGGHIYITQGLLRRLRNEAQLA